LAARLPPGDLLDASVSTRLLAWLVEPGRSRAAQLALVGSSVVVAGLLSGGGRPEASLAELRPVDPRRRTVALPAGSTRRKGPMSRAIRTERLTKYYGTALGIVDVGLEVERGEVFGFLGPNGAGKTTTIRLLLDMIRPTRGRAEVLGFDSRADSIEIRQRVGYLPGEFALYGKMTGRELLSYFSHLRRLDGIAEAEKVADHLDLDLDRKIRSYSSGNRQKLAVVQAFMHRPELVILDEPTSGLDPLIQHEFYRLVDEFRAGGGTVFLSSHILPEVERIADRVAIIRRGRIVVIEEVTALKHKALRRLELHFADPIDEREFSSLPTVRTVRRADDGRTIELTVEGSIDPVVKAAARHEVLSMVSHEGDLEEAFLAYYHNDEVPDVS
jgi:ABC-2 type transport system ATP-binding protein